MSAIGRPDGQHGFTLIEMLVVMAILALISSLAFPALERRIAAQRIESEAARIGAELRSAQASAIARDAAVVFAATDVPADLVVRQSRPIVFFGDGTSTGGTVSLQRRQPTTDAGRSFRFEIQALTGQVAASPL